MKKKARHHFQRKGCQNRSLFPLAGGVGIELDIEEIEVETEDEPLIGRRRRLRKQFVEESVSTVETSMSSHMGRSHYPSLH